MKFANNPFFIIFSQSDAVMQSVSACMELFAIFKAEEGCVVKIITMNRNTSLNDLLPYSSQLDRSPAFLTSDNFV